MPTVNYLRVIDYEHDATNTNGDVVLPRLNFCSIATVLVGFLVF